MYLFIGILFVLCVFFFVINHCRKKRIIRKICCMEVCEKIRLLNELAEPFGFLYIPPEDIMTSRKDAWQRKYGYHALFDKTAPRFHMLFDCEPIYFNYRSQTWMIELWKGQYGINTGGEVGIYKADGILTTDQLESTLFHSVPDSQMLPISMKLFLKGHGLFAVKHPHWWLTGFRMGHYCEPENLVMDVSITCLDYEMLSCLVESLLHSGYGECELNICDLTVSFTFSIPHAKQPRSDCRFRQWLCRLQNRLFCRLFRWVTRPFTCTLDRILYLYYFLPFAFRRMLRFQRSRKQKFCRRKKGICRRGRRQR